jgi:tetratricopeptide (TPR) repeat protein
MSSASDPSKAKAFFQYGNEAALKQNFDYAIDMYKQACKHDVENLLYRQALRSIERRRFNNDPAKVGRLVSAKNQPIRLRVKAAKSKQNWAHAIEVCEEAFVTNPWDVSSSRDAAEAAEQLGFPALAQWYVESVQPQATDPDFFEFAARIHKLNNSFPKAIQCWEQVKKLNPSNQIANREINALSAAATIHKSGIDEKIEERDAAPSAMASEMDDLRAQKMTPEERYLKDIKEDPKKVAPYLQLADHLKMRGQLEEAEKLLTSGLKAVPGNPDLLFAKSEIQISRINAAIEKCNRRLKEKPDDQAAKAKRDEFTKVLNEYEIKEFRRRLALDPQDMSLHYELGVRLARDGRHDEAIAAFQQARNSDTLKVKALYQAGLCFEARNAMKLAERTLQEALKAADPSDKTMILALNYRLGRVSEAQGNTQAAEEFYNEVAAVDYSYLDVAERLRSLGT